MLVQMHLEKYVPVVVYERGEKLLYLEVLKDIYDIYCHILSQEEILIQTASNLTHITHVWLRIPKKKTR